MRAPWEFSEPAKPGLGVPNLPTPGGRALGREIARLADKAEAEQTKQFPNMARRCRDCAALLGTRPNGCEETLMDFVKCTIECEPFLCHIRTDGEPNQLCIGFVLLMGNKTITDFAQRKQATP